MPTIAISRPTSFAHILEVVEKFQTQCDVSWYRGCRNKRHTLKPTLYRHPNKTTIKDAIDLETEVTTRFVQRSIPFLERSLVDDWDKLFFMQHYGVPTRLLDWSENPFVSIYFALVSASEPKSTDACLWLCNPVLWNQAALEHVSYKGGVLDQSSTLLRPYTPGTPVTEIPALPIMIYGSYNSSRIVAQRGGFALFGQSMEPMEDTYRKNDKFSDKTIQKIEIPHANIPEIRTSLFRKGFTESIVFPDLDGLSKELKRAFGF